MPKKILKIVLILIVMLSLHITYVLASDINLNLPGTDINQVDDNTQVTNEEVVNQDTSASNTNNQENVDNSINNESSNAPTDVETLQPGEISSDSGSGLSVTNIINILLITVGVILILLAIAIIIRLK